MIYKTCIYLNRIDDFIVMTHTGVHYYYSLRQLHFYGPLFHITRIFHIPDIVETFWDVAGDSGTLLDHL